jgi:hypothetical protein
MNTDYTAQPSKVLYGTPLKRKRSITIIIVDRVCPLNSVNSCKASFLGEKVEKIKGSSTH